MIVDLPQFRDIVSACVGPEHATPHSLELMDGTFWFITPHFKISYDSESRIFTFTDLNCSTTFSGFTLRHLVPGYLR